MRDAKLTQFSLDGSDRPVRFIETQIIQAGVTCDLYVFTDDSSRDLAIVRVTKGHQTPLQRVILGDSTIEGFISGAGTLSVRSADGQTQTYTFDAATAPTAPAVVVAVGQVMQWQAAADVDVTFYELCEPPYADGRFGTCPTHY